MTEIEKTIEDIQKQFKGIGIDYTNGKDMTAVCILGDKAEIVIEALREYAEQQDPKPLTLDEMNALNHEPIYILHMDGHGKWSMNGWHIATASSYRNHGRCDLEIDNGNTIIDMQNYGKTWLAYRSKLKEG